MYLLLAGEYLFNMAYYAIQINPRRRLLFPPGFLLRIGECRMEF